MDLRLKSSWPGQTLQGITGSLVVAGDRAFLTDGYTLEIVDISDPLTPTRLGSVQTPGYTQSLGASASHVFAAAFDAGLQIYEISEGGQPKWVGQFRSGPTTDGLLVTERFVFAVGQGGLAILDVSDPSKPQTIGVNKSKGWAWRVSLSGNIACVLSQDFGLELVDVTNPAQPVTVGTYKPSSSSNDLIARGNIVFIAAGTSGVEVIDIADPAAPRRIGVYDTTGSATAIALAENRLVVADNGPGLVVLDVSDPAAPKLLERWGSPEGITAVALSGQFALLGARSLSVVDVGPSRPIKQLSHFHSAVGQSAHWNHYAVVAGGPGFEILDLTNPEHPRGAGAFGTAGEVNGMFLVGNRAFITENGTGNGTNYVDGALQAVDLSVPHPRSLGRLIIPGDPHIMAISGNRAFISDGLNRWLQVDISDPAKMQVMSSSEAVGDSFSTVISGNQAFVANGESGFEVHDLSNPTQVRLMTNFQTAEPVQRLAISGTNLLALGQSLQIFDISNPVTPHLVSTFPATGGGITVSGNTVVITGHPFSDEDVQVIDISDPAKPELSGRISLIASSSSLVGNHLLLSGFWGQSGLNVVELSQQVNPRHIAQVTAKGIAAGVAVSGNYAYVANGDAGLAVIDASSPLELRRAGGCSVNGYAARVVLDGQKAFVVKQGFNTRYDMISGTVVAVDISNPEDPVVIGEYTAAEYAYDLAISGNILLLAAGQSVHLIDISDPKKMRQTATLPMNEAISVEISGNHAYFATGNTGLIVVDISDPANPRKVGRYDTPSLAYDVRIAGNYAYLANYEAGFYVFDISEPANPRVAGRLPSVHATSLTISGTQAFVPLGSSIVVIDLTDPTSPHRTQGYEVAGVYDLVETGGILYVANGEAGLKLLGLPTPPTVEPLKPLSSLSTSLNASGVALSQNNAFVIDPFRTLHVIDLSLSDKPHLIASLALPDSPKAIALDGTNAYIAASAAGFLVLDVSVPVRPRMVSRFSGGGIAQGIALSGNHAFLADGTSGAHILDVSNRTNITRISGFRGDAGARDVVLAGDHAYLLEGNIVVFDVSNPAAPRRVDTLSLDSPPVCLSVSGQRACVGTENSGVTVLDLSNPAHPLVLGNYITSNIYPSSRAVITVDQNAITFSHGVLNLLDIAEPAQPRRVTGNSSFRPERLAQNGVALDDGKLFLASGKEGLHIFDLESYFDPISRTVSNVNIAWRSFGPTHLQKAGALHKSSWQDIPQSDSTNRVSLPITGNLEVFRLAKDSAKAGH